MLHSQCTQRFPCSHRDRPSAAWAACSAMLTSRTTSSNMPSSCCNASIGGRRTDQWIKDKTSMVDMMN